jgi:hypothetical protein
MRYMIYPSPQLPRFCTIMAVTSGFEIVWTTFNFVEGSNSIFTKSMRKNFVGGFIDGLVRRRFMEVDETEFLLALRKTRARSEKLADDGVPIEQLFEEDASQPPGSTQDDHALDLPSRTTHPSTG